MSPNIKYSSFGDQGKVVALKTQIWCYEESSRGFLKLQVDCWIADMVEEYKDSDLHVVTSIITTWDSSKARVNSIYINFNFIYLVD